MTPTIELALNLLTALALGLLIGTERSWSQRSEESNRLVADIRTYGLVGLLGGLAALFAQKFGIAAWISLLVVFVVLGYTSEQRKKGAGGLSSEIAMVLTFLLGSLAVSEYREIAAGCAVIIALLLSLREPLHRVVGKLTAAELSGALKLMFISLVMLPVLPNVGYGPWQVFNPYTTWWMVVLIAGIGFAAYVAIRLVGTRYGIVATALLGGLVSSTAMTLTLARLHDNKRLRSILACGLLATSALMFPRILLITAAVNRELLAQLILPLGLAALVYAAGALLHFRTAGEELQGEVEPPLKNPFELAPALRFALLLVAILFMVEAGRYWLGDTGVYLVSALSGLTDVDAISLTLARSSLSDLSATVAYQGIFIAALVNSLVKALLIMLIGDRALAWRTVPIMLAGLAVGLTALFLQ
ncbi:MgtC/SapB family protein [Pseudomonas sp. MS19]|uniref:MgtC/SapB family protein n=1 Tax=Pseudomonas sp. MS19 TaxID=2579939 RepID=UPI001562A32E|nr:MgtC/SapB family protein [Pseudomonas sp. MS19]NRH26607.1 MgtC/SapB family protein [Pseudomonas sp. MS19]